jgi:hypothetical protein
MPAHGQGYPAVRVGCRTDSSPGPWIKRRTASSPNPCRSCRRVELPGFNLIVEKDLPCHMSKAGPKRNVPCVSWWPLPSSQPLSCPWPYRPRLRRACRARALRSGIRMLSIGGSSRISEFWASSRISGAKATGFGRMSSATVFLLLGTFPQYRARVVRVEQFVSGGCPRPIRRPEPRPSVGCRSRGPGIAASPGGHG